MDTDTVSKSNSSRILLIAPAGRRHARRSRPAAVPGTRARPGRRRAPSCSRSGHYGGTGPRRERGHHRATARPCSRSRWLRGAQPLPVERHATTLAAAARWPGTRGGIASTIATSRSEKQPIVGREPRYLLHAAKPSEPVARPQRTVPIVLHRGNKVVVFNKPLPLVPGERRRHCLAAEVEQQRMHHVQTALREKEPQPRSNPGFYIQELVLAVAVVVPEADVHQDAGVSKESS